MQILEWDELTEEQRGEAAFVDWSDLNSPALTGQLHDRSRGGRPYQSYGSLVAVEAGHVLARVGTIRVTLRGEEGDETVLGVADVITDPSALRRGLARRLMDEAHGRARRDGLELSFLSTRRSWGAHAGYESMGYRDVFSSRRALRWAARSPRRRLPPGFRVRHARRSDGPVLRSILRAASRGRLGFIPRPPESFETRFRFRWVQPRDYLILERDGADVGYALALVHLGEVLCSEAVPARPEFASPLIDALERAAGGAVLAFRTTTLLADAADEFRRRGYCVAERSHTVMMGCGLGRSGGRAMARAQRVFRDPRLFLQHPDTF